MKRKTGRENLFNERNSCNRKRHIVKVVIDHMSNNRGFIFIYFFSGYKNYVKAIFTILFAD